MTIPLEGPTTLEVVSDWTTRLLGDKGAVGALDVGVPTEGGGTPLAIMTKMGLYGPSPDLAISLLTRTPITGESNGGT